MDKQHLLKNLKIRDRILRTIREFFWERDFIEVETPVLVPAVIPESYLEYFTTYLSDRRGSKRNMFLTASPEASLKKLLVEGIGDCFEITRSFRNTETDSNTHLPEFTILEWYRVGVDYRKIMEDCEELLTAICLKIKNQNANIKITEKNSKINYSIEYNGQAVNVSPAWERISVPESLDRFTGISFDDITYPEFAPAWAKVFGNGKIVETAKKKGYNVSSGNTWEEVFNQIYLNEIEPHLGQGKATIIYDFPLPMAALAKKKDEDPRLAERFEFYIGGLELGDSFSELADWKEQSQRFEDEQKIRDNLHKTKVCTDSGFLTSLKKGLPKCSGIAVGLDRLVMLFTDSKKIQDVRYGPEY